MGDRKVRVKVKRQVEELASEPDPISEWPVVIGGKDLVVAVGDMLLVTHRSLAGRWVELPLKKVTEGKDGSVFHFFHSPPGYISVGADQVKVPKPKAKVRVKRSANV